VSCSSLAIALRKLNMNIKENPKKATSILESYFFRNKKLPLKKKRYEI
jgi:hypothetical protein